MAGDKTTTKRTAAPPASKAKGSQGGTTNEKESGSDKPLDARARACAKWIEDFRRLGINEMRQDFKNNIKNYKSTSPYAQPKFESSNRYKNIKCLEKTRVKLNRDNTPDGTDYIHASFVKISPDLVYICAQGPLEQTVEHFLLMLMQEGTKVVLQLCQNVEDGDTKCNEYYPPAEHGKEWRKYGEKGKIEVRCLDRNQNMPGMKKVMKTNMQVRMEGQEKHHDFIHILFSGWPDHGVPTSVGTLKEICNLIHRSHEKMPIIVHCSAGVGRTGTFAMIELVCHRLLVKNDMDFKMFNVARELRDQRMHSIQNSAQYIFAYRCIIEILIGEVELPKSPEVAKFIEDYKEMVVQKKKEQKQN